MSSCELLALVKLDDDMMSRPSKAFDYLISNIYFTNPPLKFHFCFRHLACEEEREVAACMLFKAGADLNLSNKDKKTPLDMCSSKLKKTLNSLGE